MTERESTSRGSSRQREREKQAPHQAGRGAKGEADCPLSREPHVGLNPRTLGSRPEPKADA